MQPRISLITLGVSDLERATTFYRDVVGWELADSTPMISFFDLGGVVFSLYPHTEMVKEWATETDASLAQIPDYRGFALAHNVASEEEVDEIFARLKERGAEILMPPRKVFWGGYSGYFADLDGHLWEVAHNPFFPLDESGRVTLPDETS